MLRTFKGSFFKYLTKLRSLKITKNLWTVLSFLSFCFHLSLPTQLCSLWLFSYAEPKARKELNYSHLKVFVVIV